MVLEPRLLYVIMVERENFTFYVEVVYEKLPYFCNHCQSIDQCTKKEGNKLQKELKVSQDQLPQEKPKPVYVP